MQSIFSALPSNLENASCTLKITKDIPLTGDILIKFFHNGYIKFIIKYVKGKLWNTKMFLYAFNTAFIPENKHNKI